MDDALCHSRKFKYNVYVIEKKRKQHNTVTKMQCTSVFEMYLARFLHSDLFYSMTQGMENQTHHLSIHFYKNLYKLKTKLWKITCGGKKKKTLVNN